MERTLLPPVSKYGHGRLAVLMQQNATVLDRNMKHLWLENDIIILLF